MKIAEFSVIEAHLQAARHVRVVAFKQSLTDFERNAETGLSLRVLFLGLQQVCQIVQAGDHVRVVLLGVQSLAQGNGVAEQKDSASENLPFSSSRIAKPFRLTARSSWSPSGIQMLTHFQCVAEQRFGLRQLPLIQEHIGQVVHAGPASRSASAAMGQARRQLFTTEKFMPWAAPACCVAWMPRPAKRFGFAMCWPMSAPITKPITARVVGTVRFATSRRRSGHRPRRRSAAGRKSFAHRVQPVDGEIVWKGGNRKSVTVRRAWPPTAACGKL